MLSGLGKNARPRLLRLTSRDAPVLRSHSLPHPLKLIQFGAE
ncbi:MAG: hypothetical protein ACI91F_003027 [Candidatus Binatia bacterium]|jgi:hypothetical protein